MSILKGDCCELFLPLLPLSLSPSIPPPYPHPSSFPPLYPFPPPSLPSPPPPPLPSNLKCACISISLLNWCSTEAFCSCDLKRTFKATTNFVFFSRAKYTLPNFPGGERERGEGERGQGIERVGEGGRERGREVDAQLLILQQFTNYKHHIFLYKEVKYYNMKNLTSS